MDDAAGPTKEQRIEAAMALAGIDFDELAKRIATKNYGSRTLRRIADPDDTGRPPRGPDLALIARACCVSEAFWTIDFSELEEPSLRDDLNRLDDRLSLALAEIGGRMGQLEQSLQEHRDTDHRGGGWADADQ